MTFVFKDKALFPHDICIYLDILPLVDKEKALFPHDIYTCLDV